MGERLVVKRLDPALRQSFEDVIGERLVVDVLSAGQPRLSPLANTIDHLIALGARCLVVQPDVQDPDFLAEHAAYKMVI